MSLARTRTRRPRAGNATAERDSARCRVNQHDATSETPRHDATRLRYHGLPLSCNAARWLAARLEIILCDAERSMTRKGTWGAPFASTRLTAASQAAAAGSHALSSGAMQAPWGDDRHLWTCASDMGPSCKAQEVRDWWIKSITQPCGGRGVRRQHNEGAAVERGTALSDFLEGLPGGARCTEPGGKGGVDASGEKVAVVHRSQEHDMRKAAGELPLPCGAGSKRTSYSRAAWAWVPTTRLVVSSLICATTFRHHRKHMQRNIESAVVASDLHMAQQP